MAYIRLVPESEAQTPLKEIYEESQKREGRVTLFLQAHSLNPEALTHLLAFNRAIMFSPTGLTRVQREMIATVVSQTNGCRW